MYFVMKPRGYGKCYKEYKEAKIARMTGKK